MAMFLMCVLPSYLLASLGFYFTHLSTKWINPSSVFDFCFDLGVALPLILRNFTFFYC